MSSDKVFRTSNCSLKDVWKASRTDKNPKRRVRLLCLRSSVELLRKEQPTSREEERMRKHQRKLQHRLRRAPVHRKVHSLCPTTTLWLRKKKNAKKSYSKSGTNFASKLRCKWNANIHTSFCGCEWKWNLSVFSWRKTELKTLQTVFQLWRWSHSLSKTHSSAD